MLTLRDAGGVPILDSILSVTVFLADSELSTFLHKARGKAKDTDKQDKFLVFCYVFHMSKLAKKTIVYVGHC